MKISVPKPYHYCISVTEVMNEKLVKTATKLNIPVVELMRIIIDSWLWSAEYANNKSDIEHKL